MHTSTELRSESFEIELAGKPATLQAALDGFDAGDRLGIVVRDPFGALGASCLLLAAVTAFYDAQRARQKDFYIYPDYFLFHVGKPLGDHSMLDIWPSHKEVVVPDRAAAILEAINDRAITWLLVAEGEPGSPPQGREALASARSRIAGALAYSPTGRVRDGDLRIAGSEVTEGYVRAALAPERLLATLPGMGDPYAAAVARRAGEVPSAVRRRLSASRACLLEDGRPVETYQRLTLDDALALLAPASSG